MITLSNHFETKELIARIKAVLRRYNIPQTESNSEEPFAIC